MSQRAVPKQLQQTIEVAHHPMKSAERMGWLLALLLFLFVFPLLGGTYWMYIQSKQEIERGKLQFDVLQARTLSALVQRELTSSQSILTSIADRPFVKSAWARRDLKALKGHLQEARDLDPTFLFVSLYETDGTLRLIVPSDGIVGQNFSYRDWYHGVAARWQPYISVVYQTAAGTHPLVVAVAVPVRDEAGKPDGILMATYGLDQLSKKFTALDRGSHGHFYVVDQHGVVIATSKNEHPLQPAIFPDAPVLANALGGGEGSKRSTLEGQEAFVAYAPVRQLGWAVIYGHFADEALAPALNLGRRNRSVTFYLLIIYLVTAAFAALLMRRQTRLLAANQTLNQDLRKYAFESQQSREELDRFFTLSLDMLCIAGTDGYFKRINPAWKNVLGHSTEELLAKPYMDFIHPDDRETTIKEAEKLGQGLDTISFQNRYLCKDGSYRWLLWSATPFSKQHLIYAVARDITGLKETQEALVRAKEQAESSSRFKDQFLSTMSHELRTPLNAVFGFSDLLIEEHYGPLNDRQKRYVKHIQAGGQHLLRLINDILDLSKIEAGRLQLTIESVPVRTVFAEVVDALRPLAEKKSQTLIQHALPSVSVRADPTRFKQILMNLLGNAIKFTPEKGRIQVRAQQLGEVVRVDVRDSGPGIPQEEQKRIFEAFYRLGQASNAIEGTGLGLAITRRLVELHGGHLGIESQPGLGSSFYFTLPIVPTSPVEEYHEEIGIKTGGSPRILVVEDDPAAANLLQSQLTSAGYEVVLCDQPQRALELAAELQPSAVTLDIIMKPINGWELLSKLKSNSRTAEIPVIVVTIVDQPANGTLLGADEYIVKPVEKATLLAAIERCLNRRGRIGRKQPILVVEDDTPTRELIAELLSKHGYLVSTAADAGEAQKQVAARLPELVILDLILPGPSGFQLLSEWRADTRTVDLPVFVLTSKDLTPDEKHYIRTNAGALLHKKEAWQENLIKQLQRVVRVAFTERA